MDTLTSTVTVIDRPDVATIALAGNDVLRYLHAVCTQHTLDLAPGDAAQALLLAMLAAAGLFAVYVVYRLLKD